MVTSNPAQTVGWGDALGSIERGKRADFVVVGGKSGDPYAKLVKARESNIALVVINGTRRYGRARLMRGLDRLEPREIAGTQRLFNLSQEGIESSMVDLTVVESETRLADALHNLPDLARSLEQGTLIGVATAAGPPLQVLVGGGASLTGLEGSWFIELDHVDGRGVAHRPRLRTKDRIRTGFFGPSEAASVPLSELLGSIELDGLAALDDEVLWDTMAAERNLPHPVKRALFRGYSRKAPPPIEAQTGTVVKVDAATATEADGLDRAARLAIVRQATLLLEQAYVHLRFKEAHHAVAPIQKLRLLAHRIERQSEHALDDEIAFHNALTRIFCSVRDLHTVYVLPDPFQRYRAVLPFLVEEYFDQTAEGTSLPRYESRPGRRAIPPLSQAWRFSTGMDSRFGWPSSETLMSRPAGIRRPVLPEALRR